MTPDEIRNMRTKWEADAKAYAAGGAYVTWRELCARLWTLDFILRDFPPQPPQVRIPYPVQASIDKLQELIHV